MLCYILLDIIFVFLSSSDNWECAEMLIEAGAELHANDIHFGTPLHVASIKGHYKCAEVLLRAGRKFDLKIFTYVSVRNSTPECLVELKGD